MTAWGPAALWAGVLFSLSAQPGLPSDLLIPHADKIIHGVLYAVLGGSLAWGHERSSLQGAHGVLIGVGVLYGASDEWHQSYVPGRHASMGDLAADAAGTVIGYLLVLSFLHRLRNGDRSASSGSPV